MSIGLFVEGESDKETILKLIRKILGSSHKKVIPRQVPRGEMLCVEQIRAYLQPLLKQHPDVSKIIVCVDSHCADAEEVQKEVSRVERQLAEMGLQPVPRYAVVVHALEGWLADAKAVGCVLGVKLADFNRNFEEVCKPEEFLDEVFSRHGRSFVKSRDDPKIAYHVNPEEIARHSPSFRQFCQLIKGP